MEKIKLLIVEDRDIIRDSIKLSLAKYDNLSIEGEATDGLEAVASVNNDSYDVVLMDINMPNMNGIEASNEIKRIDPNIEILAHSFFLNPERVFDMIDAGAKGIIKKGEKSSVYYEAIKTVANGTIYLSEEVDYSVYEKVLGYLKHPA
ncbi:MAG: response regulator [Vicingaceae bacterium]